MTTEPNTQTVPAEQPVKEITLTEEQSDELLKKAGNLTCIACPYFEPYNTDVQFGFVGKCAALHKLGTRKGGVRGWLMKFLSKYMWTMVVDNCNYYRRANRLFEKEMNEMKEAGK